MDLNKLSSVTIFVLKQILMGNTNNKVVKLCPKARLFICYLFLFFLISDYYYLFGHMLLAIAAEFITPYSHRLYL